MSVIDPFEPTYTFSYKPVEGSVIKFVKGKNDYVFKVKLDESINVYDCSKNGTKSKYFTYFIEEEIFTESSLKRFLNKIMFKKNKTKKSWKKIKHQFYAEDFYSFFLPSGLLREEDLYDTVEEAVNGKKSHSFRNYNLNDKKKQRI